MPTHGVPDFGDVWSELILVSNIHDYVFEGDDEGEL